MGNLLYDTSTSVILEATLLDASGIAMVGKNIDFYVDGTYVGTDDTDGNGLAYVEYGIQNEANVFDVNASIYCVKSEHALIAVYDPSAGFVTGGGWIMSPEGAYAPDPLLTGKANFGFVSKYKKGQSTPSGNTEFQFKAGDLNFHSSDYEWLVITGGGKAMYKGNGTINGAGEYKFMITAWDGQISGDQDTFRIKIWEEDGNGNEIVIYDNVADTVLGGGQIKIHQN